MVVGRCGFFFFGTFSGTLNNKSKSGRLVCVCVCVFVCVCVGGAEFLFTAPHLPRFYHIYYCEFKRFGAN